MLLWFMLLYLYNQNLLYFMQDLSAVYFIFLRTDLVELRQVIQESVTLSILKHAVNFFYALLLRQTFLYVVTKTC